MATGRAGFLKQKSQADEALELQKEAAKAGLFGSLGSLLGSFALTPLLGPGASVAMKALTAGAGSTLGNIAARKLGGADISKKGLWYQGQRDQLGRNLNMGAITSGLTSALTAGITPWLKGGMKDPIFSGAGLDRAGAKALQLEKFVTPAAEGTTSALTGKGTQLLEKNPAKFMRKVGLTTDTAHLWKTPVTKASEIMRETPITGAGFLKQELGGKTVETARKVSAQTSGGDFGPTYDPTTRKRIGTGSVTDDIMKLFKQQDETFLG